MRFSPSITSDRGPKELDSLAGDYVHAVGIMQSAYRVAVGAVASVVRDWRVRDGLTQKQVAERLDVCLKWVWEIENGRRRPSPEVLARLRECLTGKERGDEG